MLGNLFKKPKGIITLEGADASGKTTLAETIIKLVGEENVEYIHSGLSDDYFGTHYGVACEAIRQSNDKLVIIDRMWISEMAYGKLKRNNVSYPVMARGFDRMLIKHGAMNVLCVPNDIKAHLANFNKMREEREEAFKDIEDVVRYYADLTRGNLVETGDSYGDQFVRHGDILSRPDFIQYDMFEYTEAVEDFVAILLKRLKKVRKTQLEHMLNPTMFAGVGNVGYANVAFVADFGSEGSIYPWPTVTREVSEFNQMVHDMGLNELDVVYIDTSREEAEKLACACDAKNIKFIALDEEAAQWCKEIELVHPDVKWEERKIENIKSVALEAKHGYKKFRAKTKPSDSGMG